MSMQQDFVHPRQMDDMRAIHAAINSFSGVMTKMMMLMKELGTTLEQVSHASMHSPLSVLPMTR
ncbi:hypothetical protein CGC20_38120 [Leishmania donovani]|uniref:Uncharacterized protein n=1 Tax=Leishmania donovani TaxID=5661 RepID=A0A504XH31_LEIDO|nr:hypothetical protein CGC20_38120 [Leishmania donovani]